MRDEDDKFKFRTPPLRNIALTAPYGHLGTYNTLRGGDQTSPGSVGALYAYRCAGQSVLASRDALDEIDCAVMEDPILVQAIADVNELNNDLLNLTDKQINAIIAFLHALTDKASLDLCSDVPLSVPGGHSIIE